jgi:hypothetical protein
MIHVMIVIHEINSSGAEKKTLTKRSYWLNWLAILCMILT